jgi:hypothetical protein
MKQETLEEAAERFYPTNYEVKSKDIINLIKQESFKRGAKWQQERSYSEKDLEKAFKIGFTIGYSNDVRIDERDKSFNRWFEQFKNK